MDISQLTAEELAQLERLLEDSRTTPHPFEEDFDPIEAFTEPPEPLAPVAPPEPPTEMLDLNTGQGYWRGRHFTLITDAVRTVQRIAVAAIASDLTDEIERLRTEAAADAP